jgi:hypothetical protein
LILLVDIYKIRKGEIIMNKHQFMETIEQHPELTASGFGVTRWGDVTTERAALGNFYDAFSKSLEFLQSMSREELRKLFQHDSYTLKHVVERAVGYYIPEGAFDLAAVVFGCSVARRIKGSPSVYFQCPAV